jgi:hypothetical protein
MAALQNKNELKRNALKKLKVPAQTESSEIE